MAKFKKKTVSIFAKLRIYFITGIVVLVPIGITLYLTKFFISVSSKLIPFNLNPNNYLPFAIPGLEILMSVLLNFAELKMNFQFHNNYLLGFSVFITGESDCEPADSD